MLPAYSVRRLWVVGTLFALFLTSFLSLSAQTPETSPWLSASSPGIEKLEGVNTSPHLPESIISNRDCAEREVVMRPKRYVAPTQTKLSHQACVADSGFGSLTKTNLLQRAGSSIYGPVKTNSGGTATILGPPRSSTAIRLGSAPGYGTYLFFYDNLETTLKSNAIVNGEVTHTLPADYSAMLKDKAGNLLAVDVSSASFSPDGQWMLADLPYIGMARINIQTREVLPFGPGINYSVGLGHAYKTAISPNGRYAIIFSKNFEIFRLYDLSTCGEVPNAITKSVSCNSRDLLPFVRQELPGFTSVASMRLNNDFTVDMYANYASGSTTNIGRFLLVAPGQQASTGFQYLALGDSFASGEGAYEYKSFTDNSDNKCHLSQRSYPYLIGSQLGYSKYESVACSGAKIQDIQELLKDYDRDHAQARGKSHESHDTEIAQNYLPGYREQINFVRSKQAQILTISMSGNDIKFADKIKRCLDTDTCYDSYEDRLEIVKEINDQFDNIVSMYEELKRSGDPRAKIYVIGYPQIVYSDGVCDMNVHLNKQELVFAEQLTTYFNSVIKKAADKAGVFYVDIEEALSGRRLCEQINSWDIAVNGLTVGDDNINFGPLHGPIANESYHPNALGHSMMAVEILKNTENFTKPMPTPNPSINVGEPDDSNPLLQSPKSNRVIRKIKHYTGTDGGVVRAGTYWTYDVTGLDTVFAKGSELKAWLFSDPINLGTYVLDSNGSITIGSQLPPTLTPGFHTLHVYGKNSSGEDIDLYKTVYVDTGSKCLVPVSGFDKDKDGIDDACDGFIDKPPLEVLPVMDDTEDIPVVLASSSTNTPASTNTTNPQASESTNSTTLAYETNTPQPATTGAAVLGTADNLNKTVNIPTDAQTQTVKASMVKPSYVLFAIITLLIILSFTFVLIF